jgi:hypothetical protein
MPVLILGYKDGKQKWHEGSLPAGWEKQDPKSGRDTDAEELAAKAAAEKAKADQEAADAAAKKAQEDADAKKAKPVEEMTLEELHAVALTFDKKMPANILLETARKKVTEMLEAK